VVENHLKPAALSAMPLQKIRGSDIEEYYATVPVGSRAVHHTVLRLALRKAVKDQLRSKNPIVDIDRAPRRQKPKNADARINCWTATEAKTFLTTAKTAGAQSGALYAVALDSGARKSELCGLRWSEVDFEASRISIVQQLVKPDRNPCSDRRRTAAIETSRSRQRRWICSASTSARRRN
jgi:integrase